MVADLWCEDGVFETAQIPEQVPAHIDRIVRVVREGETDWAQEAGRAVLTKAVRFHAVCVYRAPNGNQVAVYATRRYAR